MHLLVIIKVILRNARCNKDDNDRFSIKMAVSPIPVGKLNVPENLQQRPNWKIKSRAFEIVCMSCYSWRCNLALT